MTNGIYSGYPYYYFDVCTMIAHDIMTDYGVFARYEQSDKRILTSPEWIAGFNAVEVWKE